MIELKTTIGATGGEPPTNAPAFIEQNRFEAGLG
jgi:hypothetical protein